MTSERQSAAQAARDLAGSVDALAAEVTRLNEYGRHNRTLIYAVIAGGILIVLLTAGLIVSLALVARNTATLSQVHASEIASCRAGNQTREQETALWVYIYDLAGVSKQPPAVRKEDNELIAHVRKVFAPRDCQKLYAR